jgi:hypothetical protein
METLERPQDAPPSLGRVRHVTVPGSHAQRRSSWAALVGVLVALAALALLAQQQVLSLCAVSRRPTDDTLL